MMMASRVLLTGGVADDECSADNDVRADDDVCSTLVALGLLLFMVVPAGCVELDVLVAHACFCRGGDGAL